MSSMWDYGNDRRVQPSPVAYSQGYPLHGPTKIDLKYKVQCQDSCVVLSNRLACWRFIHTLNCATCVTQDDAIYCIAMLCRVTSR